MTDPDGGIPLETIRRVMERVDRQRAEIERRSKIGNQRPFA